MLKFSADQMQEFNRIERDRWFGGLRDWMAREHADMEPDAFDTLFAECRSESERLGLRTCGAIDDFFQMSFDLGYPLSREEGYEQTHLILKARHGTADILPIKLLDEIIRAGRP